MTLKKLLPILLTVAAAAGAARTNSSGLFHVEPSVGKETLHGTVV